MHSLRLVPLRLLGLFWFFLLLSHVSCVGTTDSQGSHLSDRAGNSTSNIQWGSCGEGHDSFQCTNVSVPLDYRDASDTRTINIYVVRLPASNTTHRLGSLFLNPGGPGESASQFALALGQNLSTILNGQYDLIAFDPRGVPSSKPQISCFDSQLEEEIWVRTVRDLSLNSPSYATAEVVDDLSRQFTTLGASVASVSRQCYERVGDFMRFVGTESVARDMDFLVKILDGDEAPVNYWGWSYGSAVGQYLIQILPPERIGRVVIDGLLNPESWSKEATALSLTPEVGSILQHFADTCAAAGPACALSNLSSTEIIARINGTLDMLYVSPAPVAGLGYPAYMDAGILRSALYIGMYSMGGWPALAENLAETFAGNYTSLGQSVLPGIDPNDNTALAISLAAQIVITCNDAAPPPSSGLASAARRQAEQLAQALEQNSPQVGQGPMELELCAYVPDVQPRQSRYDGPFGLANGTLHTPILIVSQTHDPVTAYKNALSSLERLGDNARLVQQADGYGHTSLSQVSFCVWEQVQAYLLGAVPESSHTVCQVDQQPFMPFVVNTTGSAELDSLREAVAAVCLAAQSSL